MTDHRSTIEGMTLRELIARLRSLSEIQQPARLGTEPNVAWRVACREAAVILEQMADSASYGETRPLIDKANHG